MMLDSWILLNITYIQNSVIFDIFEEYSHRKNVINHFKVIKLLRVSKQTDVVNLI